MATALICSYSKTGHTRRMAEAINEAMIGTGVKTKLVDVADVLLEDLEAADAIILGSPTYYGTMAAPMKDLIDRSVKYHGKLAGKVGGAFSSSGMLGGGNETTVLSMLEALLIHGMIVIGSPKIAHYGPIAIGDPDAKALQECHAYGKRLGELTLALTHG